MYYKIFSKDGRWHFVIADSTNEQLQLENFLVEGNYTFTKYSESPYSEGVEDFISYEEITPVK
jgi:hypothetical protein